MAAGHGEKLKRHSVPYKEFRCLVTRDARERAAADALLVHVCNVNLLTLLMRPGLREGGERERERGARRADINSGMRTNAQSGDVVPGGGAFCNVAEPCPLVPTPAGKYRLEIIVGARHVAFAGSIVDIDVFGTSCLAVGIELPR